MKNEIEIINTQNVEDVMKEIQDAFYDIPFENSAYQTETFVLSAQITPERAYRQLGLRITNRMNALRAAKYLKLRNQVDIEEKLSKMNSPNISQFEKRRLEIDIMEIKESEKFTEKLINDAIAECNLLYRAFKKFPRYTRQQFEAAEENHYIEKIKRQVIGIEGSKESFYNIMHDKKEFNNVLNLLENSNEEDWLKISLSMNNKVRVEEDQQ